MPLIFASRQDRGNYKSTLGSESRFASGADDLSETSVTLHDYDATEVGYLEVHIQDSATWRRSVERSFSLSFDAEDAISA